ncbi:FecR family protein [Bordetella muralis]|uniref:FecR family protein n=1 Tax=Bordetella muralis TaxID=1649130 RepID=UPI0039F011C7
MGDPIAQAAIAWWVKLQSGEGGAAALDACRQWRAADPRHEHAWARLERFAHAVRDIPSDFAHTHLVDAATARQHSRSHGRQRRALLKGMAAVAVLGGTGAAAYEWTPWQRLVADYSTRVGERRRVLLPDDIRMDLASDTAVSSVFHDGQRELTLWRGEMGIAVRRDLGVSPLLVNIDGSRVEVNHAHFSLWRQASGMRVDVYEGSLRVSAQDSEPRVLSAGAALYRKAGSWHEAAAQNSRAAWMDGLLVANDDRLAEVIAQLARYRRGMLSVSPEVADLSVSGVFPLDDTDGALDMLQHVLPITIKRWGAWWVRVDSAEKPAQQRSA